MVFHLKKGYMMVFFCVFMVPLISYGKIHFTDVTSKYGVRGYSSFRGHGICWVDVNGDGRLDMYVKNVGSPTIYNIPNNLFINYGDYFLEEASERGVTDAYGYGTHGAVFADLDSDKDFDLFSTTTFERTTAHNHIYQNDGTGYFSDITNVIVPQQNINTSARGVAAADFDRDGDIDLYYSNALPNTDPYNPNPFPPKQTKNFYINNGDGTFTPRFRGIFWTGFVQGVAAVDIDGDGDVDIAEAKWVPPSTIYLNDGTGHFTDAGEEMGLPQTLGVRDGGMTFGDVDNDGDLDLAVIGPGWVDLYINTGNFFSIKQRITPDSLSGGAHVCLGDFDHDGDLDLYVSGGNVYENDGSGIFSLILTAESGLKTSLDTIDPRGSALGDFDQDGDLDIYISDKLYYNVLLRNDCNNLNWIQVDIIDHNRALGGIGTKLDLYVAGHVGEKNFLRGHREIHGEYGYLGQDMPTAHFGAPSGSLYDLKVTFFDGLEKVIQSITPGQKIQVAYPRVYAPLNFTGERSENKALFYRECLMTLNWDENPDNENIQKYRIYEMNGGNRMFLAEVSADTFRYMLRDVDKYREYRFALTAVDLNDTEGEAAYLTLN
ncbi:MAG: FG-GAP-like repeat-containing protein [Candidatus Aminicenantes bacterium]|nr:FG-GAP-like repeat-containing protein [Candidatus Aminicenantes bacterium]MDH5386422.1 FG-GAP-like repeat-containing protein [Candidatus Aminicenantes bacterium]